MYEDYFGLERPPFKITPDTSLFYEGGKRGDILAALVYAIHRGEGIIKVVGEVGSGKTMLCRMLQLKLPDSVEIVYIANPSVSPEDILFVIAHELHLGVTKEASKHEVMHQLHDYLVERHRDNKQVVLFIEEAQGMPIDTLEEVRLLSNLETDQHKLLQIVLFGQPELDENLAQQSIRQLRERITHNFYLEPLTQDEIHNYLNFRMREVGYTGPELINQSIAKKVEQYSDGLLRRINIIADKILLSAFAEGTHNLSAKHVTAAVNDSAFDRDRPRKSKAIWWFGLLLIAALVFGIAQTGMQWPLALETGLASNPESAAINDKSVTDISADTDQTRNVESAIEAGVGTGADTPPAEPETLVGPEPQSAPAPVEEPRLAENGVPAAAPEIEQTAPTSAAVPDQAEAVEPDRAETAEQDRVVVQQVSEVVQEIEARIQEVEARAGLEPAPKADPVLQKALDQATSSETLATKTGANLSLSSDYNEWLNAKLRQSREWLSQADRDKVSIQVLMRSKSAARELVFYLRNEWPLDLSKTYLYEVSTEDRSIYRVFYSEFDSLTHGRNQLEQLPESVKINSPYLHSVHRMQKALL